MSATASSILSARLTAARAGSSDALGQAFNHCRQYLLEIARGQLAPDLRGKGGASDLVQETYLEVQRLFPQFIGSGESQFRGWLKCLLLRKASKLGRRYRSTQKRRIAIERSFESTAEPMVSATPSMAAMADEQTRILLAAIERLPEDYRLAMQLRYREGLTFEEIGGKLGRSPDAARMIWARAVERLREELRGDRPRH